MDRSILTRRAPTGLLMGLMLMISGCLGDSSPVVVDFRKTVPERISGSAEPEPEVLRVAVGAMISPRETFVHYRRLLDYMGQKLNRKVQLVQRKTYGEVNELIGKGEIDLAFICSGPYATGRKRYGFEMIATPQVRGSHHYRAYLIVHRDSPFQDLGDLRGGVFAFTDPDSNTGKFVPTSWLAEKGEHPESFFRRTIYTYSHDNSILAVSRGLVDGASVDSLIWEYYERRKNPSMTSLTRIIKKSEPYGIPPIVASRTLAQEVKEEIRLLLLSMHLQPPGRDILDELMIERFTEPREDWYEAIRRPEMGRLAFKEEGYSDAKP